MLKSVEIYYHDLNPEAQRNILKSFNTAEGQENWDVQPLAIIDREIEGNGKAGEVIINSKPDRVAEWNKFAEHMKQYIQERTLQKYAMNNGNGIDLMSITKLEVIFGNILKYALRLHNGKAKENDLEKIAHYACFAWMKLAK